ncbi:MAG: HAD-IA family hydrolase [Gammaproteobacteria bacterium]|nr:HAD-IA family hydrolase [Gammaproteobacteria bacterium]
MTELQAANYKTLTFDCYGTLIDWEKGILGYLQPLLKSYDVNVIDSWVLEFFAETEPEVQADGGSYRSILTQVFERFADRLGFTPNEDTLAGFANSMEHWHPYADTIPALKRLGAHFQLAIISNVDDDLFAYSAKHLEVPFDHVITAQQVGTYKPDQAMFLEALKRVEAPVLHVAQSCFHDIIPATELGLHTVWIERPGASAARGIEAQPTWTFATLGDFADAIFPDAE